MKERFPVYSKVILSNTVSKSLKDKKAQVLGYYLDYCIILFEDPIPEGYSPAIILSPYCFELIE